MHSDELVSLFDQQAAGYDQRWSRTAPIREGLYFLLDALFAPLPDEARVLCVGVGTGAEMAHLASRFPGWRFTAVDPSRAMIDVCRARAVRDGFADRCSFHAGFLDTLPADAPYDAATCFLVSQFILEPAARSDFFRAIALRLRSGGLLASSDLAADPGAWDVLLESWMRMMSAAAVPPEALQQAREAYRKDVAVLPPATVADIIAAGGFAPPAPFYQAGLMHAWISRRLE